MLLMKTKEANVWAALKSNISSHFTDCTVTITLIEFMASLGRKCSERKQVFILLCGHSFFKANSRRKR